MRNARSVLAVMLWTAAVWMAIQTQAPGVAAALPQAAPGGNQAQIEKGREAVTQICTGCHGGGGGILRMVQIRTKTADQWKDTVYSMIGRGAQILPDEIDPITAYLLASSGRPRPPQPSSQGSDGKSVLERRCQQCHDLERATTKLASEEWQAVIDRMVTQGASVTAAERQSLIDYLRASPTK